MTETERKHHSSALIILIEAGPALIGCQSVEMIARDTFVSPAKCESVVSYGMLTKLAGRRSQIGLVKIRHFVARSGFSVRLRSAPKGRDYVMQSSSGDRIETYVIRRLAYR